MANHGHHPPPPDGREQYPPNPEWHAPRQGAHPAASPPPGNTLPYTYAAPGGDPRLQGVPPRGQPPQWAPHQGFPQAAPHAPHAPQAPQGPQAPHPPQAPYPHPPMPQGRPPAGPYPPRQPHGYPPPRAPYPPRPGGPPPPPPPLPYPPAAHPLGAPAPRRRGTGAAAALGGVLGVLAGVFVLFIVGMNVLRSDDRVEPVSALPTPTFTPPRPAVSSTPPSAGARRTAEATREAETRRPDRTRTVNRSLRDNTLYTMGRLPSVSCPAGSVNIHNHTQLKNLILRTAQCMNRAWGPALERVGIAHRPPGYAIAAVRGRGACGDYPPRGSIVPYYCPRNTTIYASTSAMARGSGNAPGYGQLTSWHGAIISMMAHEYGHHVQHLSGLTEAWWRQTLESTSQDAKLALSRRLELQATCLGGMWMRSVANSYPVRPAQRNILYAFYSRVGDHPGYPRDHGSPANNHRWFRQGYELNHTARCNTWRAPASAVS